MLAACVWRGAGAVRGDDEKMAHKKGETHREGGGVFCIRHVEEMMAALSSDVTLSLMFGGSACELCGVVLLRSTFLAPRRDLSRLHARIGARFL